MKTLSIVTPCYNEEAGIAECYEACRKVMSELPGYAYEHVFIDNCSGDRTVAILKEIAARDKRVKIIVNARNFGPQRSPHYALLQASGDAVTPILADLQTPPSLLPEMVRRWESGAKVVIAVRRGSDEGWLMSLARKTYYSLIKRLSKVEQIPNFIGFGLYDRKVMDVVRTLYEPDPYFRGMLAELGFRREVVEYDQPRRLHGRSRHSFFDLLDVALVALTTFSKAPMRILTLVGMAVAALSLVATLVYLGLKLAFWSSIPFGVTPILLATFFFGAVQMLAIGLVGEYVSLLLQYTRRFPLVVEDERINFD